MSREHENKDNKEQKGGEGKAENNAPAEVTSTADAQATPSTPNQNKGGGEQAIQQARQIANAQSNPFNQGGQAQAQAAQANPQQNQMQSEASKYAPEVPQTETVQGGVYVVGNKILTADGVELKKVR